MEINNITKKELLDKNVKEANKFVSKCLLVFAIIMAVVWLLNYIGFFLLETNNFSTIAILTCIFCSFPYIILKFFKPKNESHLKYIFIGITLIVTLILYTPLSYHTIIFLLLPLTLATLYFDRKLIIFTVVGSIFLIITGTILSFYLNITPNAPLMDSIESLVLYAVIPRTLIFLGMSYISLSVATRASFLLSKLIKYANSVIEAVKSKEIAESSDRAKSLFLANMSHEIRTPMNAILGMTDIILLENDIEPIKENVLIIKSACTNLLNIINDILDFSKIESNKLEIINAPYDFHDLINDIVKIFSPKFNEKNLSFNVNLDDSIPKYLIGDSSRIRQVITNLLSNAIKFTEAGEISMSITSTSNGDSVTLNFSISDTGCGIKEEELYKLFSKFERCDTKKNKSIEGSGLGLCICKSLVNLMNGDISVESTYNKGSTFSFHILQNISKESVHNDTKDIQDFKAPNANILVVDDLNLNLKVIEGLLKPYEIKITKALSGKACLDLLQSNTTKFDLIFMDHMMPELDGIETLKLIKKIPIPYLQDVPVVALTANTINGMREMFLSEGFCDFLGKPIDLSKLHDILLKYLPKNLINSSYNPTNIKGGINMNSNNLSEHFDLLKTFYFENKDKASSLRNFLNIKDFKNYQIIVHSLKSSALLIGANKLSELAKNHESNISNIDYLTSNIDSLIEELQNVLLNIASTIKNTTSNENHISIDDETLFSKVAEILDFINNFETKNAKLALDKLLEYDLQDSYKSCLNDAKLKLTLYDDDKAKDILQSLLNNSNNFTHSKKHILIIDDDAATLSFTESILDNYYKVTALNSGKKAIEFLNRFTPDIILLDLNMPELDGIDTIKQIKLIKSCSDIPVIFLTGVSDTQKELQCLTLGANDFIQKPFIKELLIGRISKTLDYASYQRDLKTLVYEKTRKIKSIQNKIIFSLATLIESKDDATGKHIKRTSRYVELLAFSIKNKDKYMDICTEDYIENLVLASPLHDIGKIAIPDSILCKPDKLTPEEFDIMKTHTIIGGETITKCIDGIEDDLFLNIAKDIALYHHEKWDGTGYPKGLSYESIPLCARIMAIADVFDALTSDRCYKDTLSLDDAFLVIQKSSGTHFDPSLVDAFLSLRKIIEKEFDENLKEKLEKSFV